MKILFVFKSNQQPYRQASPANVTFTPQGTLLSITHTKTIQFYERQLEIPLPHMPGSPLFPVTTLQQKNGCHGRMWIQHALQARGNVTSAYANLFDFNLISVNAIKISTHIN